MPEALTMEITFDLTTVTGVGAGLVVIVTGLVAAWWGLKRWIQRTARDVETVKKEIETSNGHTLGHIVERLAETTNTQLAALSTLSQRNYELIDQIGKRLDDHLQHGGHHQHGEGES